jgi:hypothetical protein
VQALDDQLKSYGGKTHLLHCLTVSNQAVMALTYADLLYPQVKGIVGSFVIAFKLALVKTVQPSELTNTHRKFT